MKTHYFTTLQTPVVDPENGIIRAVSLIEMGDAKGHFDKKGRQVVVDEVTLEQIYKQCKKLGTIKVKADHGSGVFEIVGWADNFHLTPEKVLADVHLYDSEPRRPRLLEIAEKNPTHMGVSMEFTGNDKARGTTCLSRCDEVIAAALVDDPAANSSLFSAKEQDEEPMKPKKHFSIFNAQPEIKPTEINTMEPDQTQEPTLKDLMSKFEELSTRLKALETPPADDNDTAPEAVATDPDEDPAKSDPTKTYENPDADKDTDETKKAELHAERIAEKFLTKFMSQIGVTKLSRPGSAGEPAKEKSFDDMVTEEAQKHGGNRVTAFQSLLAKVSTDETIKKAYAASRNVKSL